jgi:hypothetical protein
LTLRNLAFVNPIRLVRMVKKVDGFDDTATTHSFFRPHGRRSAAAMRPETRVV